MGLVVFDMDETLISSFSVWTRAPKRLLEMKGISGGDELMALTEEKGLSAAVRTLMDDYHAGSDEKEIFAALSELCEYEYPTETALIEGAPECVRSVRAMGHSTCVLSANSQNLVDIIRKRFSSLIPMDGWFSVKTLGRDKHSAEVYSMLSSRFSVPLESVVLVDDSSYAVSAAREGGVKAVLVGEDGELSDVPRIVGEVMG